MLQTCIVYLLRHSLDFVSWKDRKPVAAALKDIYRAADADVGQTALTAFEDGPWGKKCPAISQSWRRAWAKLSRSSFKPTMTTRSHSTGPDSRCHPRDNRTVSLSDRDHTCRDFLNEFRIRDTSQV
jgi:hypothetical protein